MTESLICLKFSSEFTAPAPMFVKVAWSIVLSFMLVIFPLWRFVINPKKPMVVDGKDD
jgi:phosphatidylserine synthase 2